MRDPSRWAFSVAAFALLPALTTAQRVPTAIRGVAYDSVRGRPLGDAFVTLDRTRSTSSDAHGRFRFDSVAPGPHVLAAQHAALDSLGFSGISTRVHVATGDVEARVATPSLGTLWRATCRAGTSPPKDSGFIYGTVVDAVSKRPIAGAVVGLTWLNVGVDRERTISVQQFAGAGQSNALGAYVICGVPIGTGLRVQATVDSAESGVIELAASDLPIQRRDLQVSVGTAVSVARRGTVVGEVRDMAGNRVPGARVVVDAAETRTDSAGRYVLRDVLPGSRQVEALAIGMSPESAVLDVGGGDTATFSPRLRRIPTLDVVRVIASARGRRVVMGFEDRKRTGLGYARDSTIIARTRLLSTVFDQFPATMVRRDGGTRFSVLMKNSRGQWCPARVWLDGQVTDPELLGDLHPEDIAAIEAYPHASFVPTEFTSGSARTEPCGAAVVWTKHAFR